MMKDKKCFSKQNSIYLVTKPHLLDGLEFSFEQEIVLDYNEYGRKMTTHSKDVDDIQHHDDLDILPSTYGVYSMTRKITTYGATVYKYKNEVYTIHVPTHITTDAILEKVIKNSINVTNYDRFSMNSLWYGNNDKIVLEGCDLVGKTHLSKELVRLGHIVQERDINNISSNIRENIDINIASEKINTFIKNNPQNTYVIMTAEDYILDSRLEARAATTELSEFDKICKTSNSIYKALTLNAHNIIYIDMDGSGDSIDFFYKNLISMSDSNTSNNTQVHKTND